MLTNSLWITSAVEMGDVCPEFKRRITLQKEIKSATLTLTAIGVYEAYINGERVGDFIFAPGCTTYGKRLQYQVYDITDMLKQDNDITVRVGAGWHRGRISANSKDINEMPCAIIAAIDIVYADGTSEKLITDKNWKAKKSKVLFSDFYDGEIYDATAKCDDEFDVKILDLPKDRLILQEGEKVCEHERLKPLKLFTTPKGERVLDFGQNMAGYIEFCINAKYGDKVKLSCAEVLDSDGNFYTENYRTAKSALEYICTNGVQTYKPHFTFMGFRYIRIDDAPDNVCADDFTAIALYSDMKRTGFIECADERINKLFSNTLWSQRANFIDIPTDCPQRDERMGWLGDAQVFAKAAGYNYNVEKFFAKWLGDLRAEQRENGSVPDTVPNFWKLSRSSTAWGDAITIIPWTMYTLYGDKTILEDNFDAMKAWVDYITNDTLDKYLWTSSNDDKKLWGKHYGDWLGIDAPEGSYKGSSDEDLIASAFYAYSTKLVIKAGNVLGKDVSEYERLYENIVKTYKARYNTFKTQTECVLTLHFNLTDDKAAVAQQLADMVRNNGNKLQTGFVGAPYLLYALSENGYVDTAYDLLLQNEYPSWLYEVEHGATSIWEHWDGIRNDGSFWSKDMNSYNHYAYGSVMDWVYSVAAGIKTVEKKAGFEEILIAPKASVKMGWLSAALDTAYGTVVSKWHCTNAGVRYEISVPVKSTIIIDNKTYNVEKGDYVFYEAVKNYEM